MTFWGIRIKPYRRRTLRRTFPKKRLRITPATLDINPECNGIRTSVWCFVGNKPGVILCAFTDKESISLDLEFKLTENVVFEVWGKRGVSLTGYFLKCDNDNEAPTVYVEGEEDLENTDGEHSSEDDSEEDEYDFDDSFIDDSDLINHRNFPEFEDC